ncbi:MAG: helix-turn-helix domain containing protein [Victivallales bacterium]|nr:helix-turn-helix domain containing protein [Victivallales bacterium]
MTTYANTGKTRTGLMMAAGELFAEHGIDAVTVRQIAKTAGESIGNIHYHFGGKDGLLQAVMDFVGQPWQNDPLGHFLAEHRSLLTTSEGQTEVLRGMLEIFWSLLYSPERPAWCCTLGFQILQRDLAISRRTFDATIASCIKAFIDLYYAGSGDHDFERAYNWSTAITAPAVIDVLNRHTIVRLHPEGKPSAQYLTKLKESWTRNALDLLGELRHHHRPTPRA